MPGLYPLLGFSCWRRRERRRRRTQAMMPTMASRATTPAIMPPRRVGEMPRDVSAPVRLAELEDEVLEELPLLLELGEEVEVEDEPEVPFEVVSQML